MLFCWKHNDKVCDSEDLFSLPLNINISSPKHQKTRGAFPGNFHDTITNIKCSLAQALPDT